MKQQMLSEISSKLLALGIPVQNGNGADITISTEFLDASWSTGRKKISYEASVFANEQDNTIYMYEKTTEISSGISFGVDSTFSFQRGRTLFRKVKAVHYGPDGKAYEYTLDLKAIPEIVRETAILYNWKFKTVINKNMAMYPPGYIPVSVPPVNQWEPIPSAPQVQDFICPNCHMSVAVNTQFCSKCGKPIDAIQQPPAVPPIMPVQSQYQQSSQPQYNNPQGSFYAQGKAPSPKGKAGTLGLIAFILLGVITAIIYLLYSVSQTGLIIGAATLLVFGFLQRKIAYKGCFLSLVLLMVTVVILLLTLSLTLPSSG